MRAEYHQRWPQPYITPPYGRNTYTFSWQTGFYLTDGSHQNLKIYVGTEKSVTLKKAKRKYEECFAISEYQKALTIQNEYSEYLDYHALDLEYLIDFYPAITRFITKKFIAEKFEEKNGYRLT